MRLIFHLYFCTEGLAAAAEELRLRRAKAYISYAKN